MEHSLNQWVERWSEHEVPKFAVNFPREAQVLLGILVNVNVIVTLTYIELI